MAAKLFGCFGGLARQTPDERAIGINKRNKVPEQGFYFYRSMEMRTVDWSASYTEILKIVVLNAPTWFVVKRKQKPFSNQETMTTTKRNPVQTVQPDGYTTMLDTAPEPGAVN